MPVYAYKGMTNAGRATRGFVDADNARAARAKLRRDGVYPTEISESGNPPATVAAPTTERRRFAISLSSLRRISGMDLALATRQLSTLVGERAFPSSSRSVPSRSRSRTRALNPFSVGCETV